MNPRRNVMQLITGCTGIAETTAFLREKLEIVSETVSMTVYRTRTAFGLFGNKTRLLQQVVFCVLMVLLLAFPVAAEDPLGKKIMTWFSAKVLATVISIIALIVVGKFATSAYKALEEDNKDALKDNMFRIGFVLLFLIIIIVFRNELYDWIFSLGMSEST